MKAAAILVVALAGIALSGCTATSKSITDSYASLDKCTQAAIPVGVVLGIPTMGPAGVFIGPMVGAGGCYAYKHFSKK